MLLMGSAVALISGHSAAALQVWFLSQHLVNVPMVKAD